MQYQTNNHGDVYPDRSTPNHSRHYNIKRNKTPGLRKEVLISGMINQTLIYSTLFSRKA